MALSHDVKYVSLISSRLEKFKRKSEFLWNFRCPICKDSKKNKNKARGYIYRKKSALMFKCHNCGRILTLGTLIKNLDKNLYDKYVLDRYKSGVSGRKPDKEVPYKPKTDVSTKFAVVDNLIKVIDLPDNHAARKYLKARMIPEKFFNFIYFTECFSSFVNSLDKTGKYKNLQKNDARIVFLMRDQAHYIIGAQGRTLGTSELRYITVTWHPERVVYGLDRWDQHKKTYIVEGPIDSLFLKNAIASVNADLISCAEYLIRCGGSKDNLVLAFDNEKRNKEIVSNMERAAKAGYNICVWPKNILEKDINDMILHKNIPKKIIDNNTYEGLESLLKISEWKKA